MPPTAQENHSVSRYLGEIRRYPVLSRDEERLLARRLRAGGDDAVRNDLVQANLGFVVKVAREYSSFGVPFEDLLNEGNLGLIEAARRFDDAVGTKFITYASWWIRKSILRALGEHNSLIRVPDHQRKKLRQIRDAEQSLKATLGRRPLREELSQQLRRSVVEIDRVLRHSVYEVPIDDTGASDEERPILNSLRDERAGSPEDVLLGRELQGIVQNAFAQLGDRERLVLRARLGLIGERPWKLSEIGRLLGISRERARQIESASLQRIRRILTRETGCRPKAARTR